MSKEAASQFVSKISQDLQLQGQLGEAQVAALVEFAAKRGYEFTNEELLELANALVTQPSDELSDEQLAAAAGGLSVAGVLTGMIRRDVLNTATGLKGRFLVVVSYGGSVPGSGQNL